MSGMNDFLKKYEVSGNFDPNNTSDQEKIKQMLSEMNPSNAEKVMALLNDPAETTRLMQTPAAQKLMKLLGGSNG